MGGFRPGQAGRHTDNLFYHSGPEAIYLLTAYAKADRDDLTSADKKVLSRLVTAIKKRGTDK